MESFSLRRLQPFEGVVRIVQWDGARAFTLDGRTWQVQLATDASAGRWSSLDRDTAVRRYAPVCFWTRNGLLRELPIAPTLDTGQVRRRMRAVLAVLGEALDGLAFPPGDPYELWLLDDRDGAPLALMASVRDSGARERLREYRWRPFPFHQVPPVQGGETNADGPPLALQLQSAVNRRGGTTHTLQWFLRELDGAGLGLEGRHLPAAWAGRRLPGTVFPELLLREDAWLSPGHAELVQQYHALLAPRLLALAGLTPATRRRLEQAAWANPILVRHLHQTYPEVLDRDALNLALIQAQLIENERPGPGENG